MPHLDVPGATIYYETEGRIGDPAILLLHAGVATLRMWDPLVTQLAGDHFVIRFDERGYGRTTAENIEFSDRRDALEILDHLGVDRALLIGGSRGGGIALDLALETPARATGVVTICGGVSGFPDLEPTPAEEEAWARVEAAEASGDAAEAAREYVRFWTIGVGRDERDLDPAFVQLAYALHRPNAAHREDPPAIALDPPAYVRLDSLMVPLLAVAGKADLSETVVVQEYLVGHVPEGEGYLFHDAAHLPSVERPEEFAAVLSDWMARKGL
jgi:pimeloyl-ACP methyl ester carboxylesterase